MLRYITSIILAGLLLGCIAEADPPSEDCGLTPDPGPCKARMEKFFYNKDSHNCEVFFWGGCDGVVPFDTINECMQSCMPEQASKEPVCEFEGTLYAVGDSWPVDCNTCICDRVDLNAPPEVVCTEMACGNTTAGLDASEETYPYTVTLKLGESKSIPGGEITFTELTQDEPSEGNTKVFLQIEQTETPPTTLFIDVAKNPDAQTNVYIHDLYLQLKHLLPQPPNSEQSEDPQYIIELLIDKNAN